MMPKPAAETDPHPATAAVCGLPPTVAVRRALTAANEFLKLDRQAELILAISPVRVRGQRGARPWWSRGSGLWLASPDSSARP